MTFDHMSASRNRTTRFIDASKLYWGLIAVFLAGVFFSPHASDGGLVFLDPINLTNVLRQVSLNGMLAVGMTLVILTAGIDLSVGTMMALGGTLCAILLTTSGTTAASVVADSAFAAVVAAILASFAGGHLRNSGVGRRLLFLPALAAIGVCSFFLIGELRNIAPVPTTVVQVICVGLTLGAGSGAIIAWGRLQPFIVTLAMMVAVLGFARLVAGQDQSVYPIYAGVNAPASVDLLRLNVLGILPVPGLVFLGAVFVFGLILARFQLGRYIYAVGGNEKAAWLAGVPVQKVKLTVYALSGAMAALAGVFYAAQFRQGKPDAGIGWELDAIAAVVIGGTSLMGGRGRIAGTLVGVLIFGLLTNILQLNNVDANMQLVLKGAIILAAVLLQEGRLLPDLPLPRRRRKL